MRSAPAWRKACAASRMAGSSGATATGNRKHRPSQVGITCGPAARSITIVPARPRRMSPLRGRRILAAPVEQAAGPLSLANAHNAPNDDPVGVADDDLVYRAVERRERILQNG